MTAKRVLGHAEFATVNVDGLTLRGQAWMPAQPLAVIALVHGLAEHGGRYAEFAQRANSFGIGVVSVDLRGHGKSPGVRLFVEVFDDYLFDVDALLAQTRLLAGECPVFLMGHSLGGAIALRWVDQRRGAAKNLRGLLLSSAALKIGPGTPALLIKLAPLISRWFPLLRLQALNANLISSIPAEVARYLDDPLVCKLPPPTRTGAEVLAIMPANLDAARELKLPLYVFHGTDDTLTSPEASQALYDAWGGSDKHLRLWPGSLHETLNDIDRDAVMDEMFAWLLLRAKQQ